MNRRHTIVCRVCGETVDVYWSSSVEEYLVEAHAGIEPDGSIGQCPGSCDPAFWSDREWA